MSGCQTAARWVTLATVTVMQFSQQLRGGELACTQALAAGKSRVIVNGMAWVANGTITTLPVAIEFMGGSSLSANGFTLNFSKGFRASDTDAIFSPTDSKFLVFPQWQRLTPHHFGAKGDYVSAAAPGTDDGDALIAWASKLCARVMPSGRFGTTKTVPWNGDVTGATSSYGIRAEGDAEIIQRTDNIPVMTFYGSRGEWRFPKLSFMNDQPTTNYGAICLLCATYPGRGNGFYMSSVPYLHTYQGSCGVYFPAAINSTAALAAAVGSTTIKVANAQTDLNGSFPWVPGMFVQIELDTAISGKLYFTTKITKVVTDVLTLRDSLPGAVSVGKRVAVAPNVLTTSGQLGTNPARFSNTWTRVLIENPTRWGWIDRGFGTQDVFVNRYVTTSVNSADITSPLTTLVSAIHETFRNQDKHGITNIEHFKFTGNGWDYTSDPVNMGSIHFENCRLTGDNTALIGAGCNSLRIQNLQVVYCTMLGVGAGGEIATSCRLIAAKNTANTPAVVSSNKGTFRIENLHTQKNIIDRSVAFLVRDGSGNLVKVDIDNWQPDRDGGFYPYGQLSYPVNKSALTRIGNLMPDGAVAYRFDADLTTTNSQDMYPSNKGQFRITKIAYAKPTKAITTATAGVWNEAAATNLVSASGVTALTPLSAKATIVEPGVHTNEANKLRAAGTRIYFRCGTAEVAPAAIAGQSSYLTGRNAGATGTNLGVINCTAHGRAIGEVVDIAGSVNTALNGTFKVVEVPSSDQLVVYCDSATTVGSAGAPIADAAITVRLRDRVRRGFRR